MVSEPAGHLRLEKRVGKPVNGYWNFLRFQHLFFLIPGQWASQTRDSKYKLTVYWFNGSAISRGNHEKGKETPLAIHQVFFVFPPASGFGHQAISLTPWCLGTSLCKVSADLNLSVLNLDPQNGKEEGFGKLQRQIWTPLFSCRLLFFLTVQPRHWSFLGKQFLDLCLRL